jgi:outer membrane protein assembly factor BamB
MSDTAIDHLRDALGLGLGIVTRVWDFKVRDWVTSVSAADINNDGEAEIIACSRDGRVCLLTATKGDWKWERVIGEKAWVGTGTAIGFSTEGSEGHLQPNVVIGTRDGKVYCLDKDGRTITRDGKLLSYDKKGRANDTDADREGYWYKTGSVIRQIYINPENTMITIGSEDRCAYGIDYKTGELRWRFQTNGWVRAVCSYDINNDGVAEILVGSVDKSLYVLDSDGQMLAQHNMRFPIHNIVAADVDQDGCTEILVGTDGKELAALTYNAGCSFTEKWRHPMLHRILSLCVADLDGDGQAEIIAGSEDKHIYFLDSQGKIIWRHQQPYRVYSLFPYDIDKDGIPELLVGSDDNVVRAMRVRLRRGMDKNIRKYYRQLDEPDPASIKELTPTECNLLRDVLSKGEIQDVTLKQAEDHMSAGDYIQALSTLLRLEQQRAQPRWPRKKVGHIRSISFRHTIGKSRREIIVGTSDGEVLAYNTSGSRQWSTQLEDRIIDVQTGFIDHNIQEEIVICSSDHHVYILSGTNHRHPRKAHIETRLSSVCVASPHQQSPAQIIIGSEEKKLYIYGSELKEPVAMIDIGEGIRVVRTHSLYGDHKPEIIAGCLDNCVYAYTRHGKLLWRYQTHDHIRSICLKDINGDGNIEVIVGSEDRNIHVLDSTGYLLWRYFLPHSVLSVDAADADLDGTVEIFAGCADGYLYVFNRDGDYLWKYHARDRIHAVRVEDIDDDGYVEIALGSENELELLQVANLRTIHDLIDQCWFKLCQTQPSWQVLSHLLYGSDSFLQSFALGKFTGQDSFSTNDFDILEQFAKSDAGEIHRALVSIVELHFQVDPIKVRQILLQLSKDSDQEVRDTFVENLPLLMKYDWEAGLLYLKRFSESDNRYVRRLIVRALHQLVDTSTEMTHERQRKIFDLLLAAALDKGSEWVRLEAARTLAHFLDRYNGRLIVNVQMFIVKEVEEQILLHIAHTATMPVVKNYLFSVIPMLDGLNDGNMLERTQQVVTALEAASGLVYSRDLCAIYAELCRLLTISSIVDLAQYQCSLNMSQFIPDNQFAQIILDVFKKLSSISRTLRIYLRREGLPDRLSSLLDAIAAIDNMAEYLEQPYSRKLKGEPISKLPDHQVFLLLCERWRRMVQAKINELRGKAEFTAELQAKQARLEDQVGVWLVAQNIGRGTANNVRVTLLHNDDFPVVGKKTVGYDIILPQEKVSAEFIVEPKIPILDLRFAIAYDDAERTEKEKVLVDRLELRELQQEFSFIPNPYSTGAPTHDSRMFFGREADMAYLRDNLTREAKTVLILYGQRRTGKTTLLFQLISSGILGENVPVLIDMQGLALNINIRNFLYKVAYAIAQAMKKNNLQVCDPVQAKFEAEPTHAFDVFLDDAETFLGKRKLILMVDEFEVLEEQVVKQKLEHEIFQYLRNILQHRQNINFLFAGTHKITEHTKWYRSIFFNIARHYRLTRLNQSGAAALIQQPVIGYLEYEPLTVEKLLLLTNNQPYLLHLLCRAIVDYGNDRRKTYVTINDVNLVLRDVMQTIHFHFDWLWDQITPEERVVLSALAEGGKEEGRWLTLDEIIELYQHANIRFKREYLLDSLRSLIDADIIESEKSDIRDIVVDSSRFRIPVGLTRRWLLRDKPLDLIRSEEMIG